MKASRYNFFFKEEGLLFNAVSCGFAKIQPSQAEVIKKILDNPCPNIMAEVDPDTISKLIEGGFLLDDDFDEVALLRARYDLRRFSSNNFVLSILPTLDCNFDCIYCYEEKKKGKMGKSVVELIKELVYSLEHLTRFGVIWYGGEPLLYPEIIFDLSSDFVKYCRAKNIQYSASMITNGYLLTRPLAKKLKEEAMLSLIQITLDGPPEVHNKRRFLRDGKPTFSKVLSNLIDCADLFSFNVRINVDKDNAFSLPALLSILKQANLTDKISLSLGAVTPSTKHCQDYAQKCFQARAYAQFEINALEQMAEVGFRTRFFPRPVEVPCMAVSPFNFVIDPEGHLYKCLEAVGEKEEIVGDLPSIDLLTNNLIKWLTYDPFSLSECRECKIFPICLGGCPRNQLRRNGGFNYNCQTWRFFLKEMLLREANLLAETR